MPGVLRYHALYAGAERLAGAHGGHWAEHPDYPAEDWQIDVANDDTRLGYWAWVANMIDQEAALAEEQVGV